MEDTYWHFVAEMNRIGILYQHPQGCFMPGGRCVQAAAADRNATPVQGITPAKRQLRQRNAPRQFWQRSRAMRRFGARSSAIRFGRTARKRLADRHHNEATVYTPGPKGYIDHPTYKPGAGARGRIALRCRPGRQEARLLATVDVA